MARFCLNCFSEDLEPSATDNRRKCRRCGAEYERIGINHWRQRQKPTAGSSARPPKPAGPPAPPPDVAAAPPTVRNLNLYVALASGTSGILPVTIVNTTGDPSLTEGLVDLTKELAHSTQAPGALLEAAAFCHGRLLLEIAPTANPRALAEFHPGGRLIRVAPASLTSLPWASQLAVLSHELGHALDHARGGMVADGSGELRAHRISGDLGFATNHIGREDAAARSR